MSDLVGHTLNRRYRIDSLIGRGGMADVYRAYDTRRGYPVAIKVLREDLAEDWEFVRRFQAEAEHLSRLAHQNIVRFYSFEQDGRLAFIVMDYVEGDTLRGRIFDARGPLPPATVLHIARQLASALHYAHSEGIWHRDVKPANVMLTPRGDVLLSDFGIAKASDIATSTSATLGTPAYMSPEQCAGLALDARTDVYSLGVVLYEMLTGRRPFTGSLAPDTVTGGTGERILWEQMYAPPPSPRQINPAVPEAVAQVVLCALAKERNERFQSVQALIHAIEHAQTGQRAPRPEDQAAAMPPPAPSRRPQMRDQAAGTPRPAPRRGAESKAQAGGTVALPPGARAPGVQRPTPPPPRPQTPPPSTPARPRGTPAPAPRRAVPRRLVLALLGTAAAVLVLGNVLLFGMLKDEEATTPATATRARTATAAVLPAVDQASPAASDTGTVSPTPTGTRTPTSTATPSATPSRTPTPTGTRTPTATASPTLSSTPTARASATPSRTATRAPTKTATARPTATPQPSPTQPPPPTNTQPPPPTQPPPTDPPPPTQPPPTDPPRPTVEPPTVEPPTRTPRPP